MPTLRCDTIVLAGKKITKNSKVVCCHLLEGFVLWCVSAAVTGPRASPRPFSFVWLEISPHGNDHLRVLNKQEVWSCANAQKCKANPALAFDCSCKWHQWQFSTPALRQSILPDVCSSYEIIPPSLPSFHLYCVYLKKDSPPPPPPPVHSTNMPINSVQDTARCHSAWQEALWFEEEQTITFLSASWSLLCAAATVSRRVCHSEFK